MSAGTELTTGQINLTGGGSTDGDRGAVGFPQNLTLVGGAKVRLGARRCRRPRRVSVFEGKAVQPGRGWVRASGVGVGALGSKLREGTASCTGAAPEGIAVKMMSYSESRARYAEVLDSVVDDREEVVVTRSGHDPVVIPLLAEFESLREMAYLMRSPRMHAA